MFFDWEKFKEMAPEATKEPIKKLYGGDVVYDIYEESNDGITYRYMKKLSIVPDPEIYRLAAAGEFEILADEIENFNIFFEEGHKLGYTVKMENGTKKITVERMAENE